MVNTPTDLRPSPTTPHNPTIPQKVTNVSNYRKGAEYYVVLSRILQMYFAEFPLRDCLKSLASLKTNASKPTKQSKEGSFRCDMPAISALETLLSDFLDSFYPQLGE